jgi:hypothetical protein
MPVPAQKSMRALQLMRAQMWTLAHGQKWMRALQWTPVLTWMPVRWWTLAQT